MVLKLYMIYILYLNHGKELKDKSLSLIWFFYVSAIKVDDNGSLAGQEWYILRYHVNIQFNKIPQLAMHCNERDGGMISQGIQRGII